MLGFLQRFYAEEYLIEVRDATVTRYVIQKAIEIAMLGLVDECNAICTVLANHGQFKASEAGLAFQCMWLSSSTPPPGTTDAVWKPSLVEIHKQEFEARHRLMHIGKGVDWIQVDADALENVMAAIEKSPKDSYRDAMTGYTALLRSQLYAAAIHMASDLGRSDVIEGLMPVVAQRIHANGQARYLSEVPIVWKDYLLSGWLRERLGLTKETVQGYARYILDTATERFEHGPCRPEDIWPGYGVAQLLEVVNDNTVSSEGSPEWLRAMRPDDEEDVSHDGDTVKRLHSIMRPGVTTEQIAAAEQRIRHKFPDELVDFFRLTNGCDPVRVGENHYRLRLPPLNQIYFENKEYMGFYGVDLLPGLPHHLRIDWPEFRGGGVAMYESDGQGTQYVWIIGADQIRRSKDRLQTTYNELSVQDKATIDHYIRYWYGERQSYDAMTDHCYIQAHWGQGARAVYPSLRAYLAMVACQSRYFRERSPLAVPRDL